MNFRKTMFSGAVRVGEGQVVTVADVEVTIEENEVNRLMERCRQEALADIGLLAACLDERVGTEILSENLYVLDAGDAPMLVADRVVRRRTFVPSSNVNPLTQQLLSTLGDLTDKDRKAYGFGARWFQKAVTLGPTPDAVVMLWAAAEGLAQNYCVRVLRTGAKGVKAIESAVAHLGHDISDFPISIGRVFGVRSEVVHQGTESHDHMDDAYYELEMVVRLLLRK